MQNSPMRIPARLHRLIGRRALMSAVVAAGVLGATACFDLQVNNPNTLNNENVFNNAANSEAAVIGGWRRWWGHQAGNNTNNGGSNCPTIPFSLWGNELTSTTTTYIDYFTEPRPAINNVDNLNCVTRTAWYDLYTGSASGRDVYQGIVANNLTYGAVTATTPEGADTPRIKLFSRFLVAISQLYVGLEFDKGFIADTSQVGPITDVSKLVPAAEVLASAQQQLRDVIKDAKAAPDFTLPATWVNGNALTRDDFVRVMYSFLVRGDVYAARNPTQRAAVNWGAVLLRLDSAITTTEFFQVADPLPTAGTSPTRATYINTSFSSANTRPSNRLVGPADTTGAYQTWLATPLGQRVGFTMFTPDKRFWTGTVFTNVAAGQGPGARGGILFEQQTTIMSGLALGSYLGSRMRSIRYLTATADTGSRARVPIIAPEEMRFIRAEALYRLGRGAEAAALINISRTAPVVQPNGTSVANLPPVTASGTSGGSCVPRKNDGTCGDLFDALQYEKRIVLFPYPPVHAWFDQRGWGKLVQGTPFEMPVSGREMVTLGGQIYTFGGNAGNAAGPGNP